MTWGCIPQVQSCLGRPGESATLPVWFLDRSREWFKLTASRPARANATAIAAMTILFMGFRALRNLRRAEARFCFVRRKRVIHASGFGIESNRQRAGEAQKSGRLQGNGRADERRGRTHIADKERPRFLGAQHGNGKRMQVGERYRIVGGNEQATLRLARFRRM